MTRYFSMIALALVFLAQGQSLVLDPNFGTNGTQATQYQVIPKNGYFYNNKYYLFGNDRRFARFNYDGSVDGTFGNSGFQIFTINGQDTTIKNFKMHNGKCYGFGFTEYAGMSANGLIIRLTENGQLDPTFGNNGIVTLNLGQREYFNDIVIKDDGAIYAIGYRAAPDAYYHVLVSKFLENGSADTSFNATGSKVFPSNQNAIGNAIFLYGNDIVLGHATSETNGGASVYLQKMDSNGNLMTDFGTNGEIKMTIPPSITGIDLDALKWVGNKVYVHFHVSQAFTSSKYYGLDVFDITNPASILWTTQLYSDSYFNVLDSGKVMVARGMSCSVYSESCSSKHFTTKQYNADGTLDTSFDNDGLYEYDFSSNPNTTEGATYCYQHDDGRIFMAGYYTGGYLNMLRVGSAELVNTDFNAVSFSVYPNPSSKMLYINNKNNALLKDISISDISGKKIKPQLTNENGIDIGGLSNGIYFLSFNADGNSHIIKFIKS